MISMNIFQVLDFLSFLGSLDDHFKKNQGLCISLSTSIINNQELNSYPAEIQNIYHSIFNHSKAVCCLFQILPFKSRPSQTEVCLRKIEQTQNSFVCYDCTKKKLVILCEQCINLGNHKGHRIENINKLGYCQCGNQQLVQDKCPNHSKKMPIIEVIQIDQNAKHFQIYLNYIFKWYFNLMTVSQQNSQVMGHMLAGYLTKLTQNSSYYIKLTSQLLLVQNQGKCSILQQMLKQNKSLSNKGTALFTNLFLKMMSNEQFKLNLAKNYVLAYNVTNGFESMYRKVMFNQLLECSLFQKVRINYGIILSPVRKANEELSQQCYYQHLTKIIKQNSSVNYILEVFRQRKILSPSFLVGIQSKLALVTADTLVKNFQSFIQIQNKYLQCMNIIFSNLTQNRKYMQTVLKQLFTYLKKSQKNSNNPVILPIHRSFIIGIFIYFNCNLQSIQYKNIIEILEIEEQQLCEVMVNQLQQIIICIQQFSSYMHKDKGNYFKLYLGSYLNISAFKIGKDFLYLRVTAILLHQMGKKNLISQQLINIMQKILSSNQIIQFVGILSECIFSERPQIYAKVNGKLNEIQFIKAKRLLASFLNSQKQFIWEELNILTMNLLGVQLNQDLIHQLVIYNRSAKRLKSCNNQLKMPFAYYPSLTKMPNYFGRYQNQPPVQIQISVISAQILDIIYNQEFIYYYGQKILGNQQDQETIKLFTYQLLKINYLFQGKNNNVLNYLQKLKLNQKLKYYQPFQKFKAKSATKIENQNQIQIIPKIIKSNKIEELRKKMNKAAKKHLKQDSFQIERNDGLCMICQEHNQTNILCLLGRLTISNSINRVLGIKGNIISMMGCTHHIHLQCCMKTIEQKTYFKCPFCQNVCNILIPLPEQFRKANHPENIVKPIFDRISVIQSLYASTNSRVLTKQESYEQIFINIMKSFLQLCYFRPIQNMKRFMDRELQFTQSLFCLAKHYYQSMIPFQYSQRISQKTNKIISQFGQCEQLQYQSKLLICQMMKALMKSVKGQNIDTISVLSNNSQVRLINHVLFQTLMKQPLQYYRDLQILQNEDEFYWINKIKNKIVPPKTAAQLIKRRSQIKQQCKTTHYSLFCCLCGAIVCPECKTLSEHIIKKHYGKCMFINLRVGVINLSFKTFISISECVYLDKYGKKWKPQYSSPHNFVLDEQEYNKFLNMDVENTIQSYIAKLLPIEQYEAIISQRTINFESIDQDISQ